MAYTGAQPGFGAYNPGKGFTVSSGYPFRNGSGVPTHWGVDFQAARGTGIPAAADGVVAYKDYNATYGNYVVLQHNSNGVLFYTLYAHMDSPSPLVAGTSVNAGDTIGNVGNTGYTTKNGQQVPVDIHLHMEVRTSLIPNKDGATKTYNPLEYSDWGTSAHMIGTDAYGNKLIAVSSGGADSVTAITPTGNVIYSVATSTILDSTGCNIIGYSHVALDPSSGTPAIATQTLADGTIASRTYYGNGTTTTYQSGITITTDIATGIRTALVSGADAPARVAADGTITGTSAGVSFTISLPDDPLGDTAISVGGRAFTAHAGSAIEIKNGGLNIVESAPVLAINNTPQTLTTTTSDIAFDRYDSAANTVWMYENGVTVIKYSQNSGTFKVGDVFWSIPTEGGQTVEITKFANNGYLNVTKDQYGNEISTLRTLADGTVWQQSNSVINPGDQQIFNGVTYRYDGAHYVDVNTGQVVTNISVGEPPPPATTGPMSSINDPATLLDPQFFLKTGFNPNTTLAAPEVVGHGMVIIAGQNVTYEATVSGGVTSISYSNGNRLASYKDDDGAVTILAYDRASNSYVLRNPDGTGSLQMGNASPVAIGQDDTIGWRDDGTPVILKKWATAGLGAFQINDPFALNQIDEGQPKVVSPGGVDPDHSVSIGGGAGNNTVWTFQNIERDLNSNPLSTTTTNYDGNVITQTVKTTLNGNTINVTYTYDSVTGEATPHVNSINGQPPTDQAAADAAFKKTGVLPGQLMYGDSGVSGTNASGVVSTFDAIHPTGLQTLGRAMVNYAPTLLDALSLIKAIQSGQPLPIVSSGLRLANTQIPRLKSASRRCWDFPGILAQ